jgi:CRISPR-associated exonuclease Cas4
MPDGNEILFRVTDLKQYQYCKRILYYHTCLPDIRPITYKMKAGIEAHETQQKNAARRSLGILGVAEGSRHFDVTLTSLRLGLTGEVDEIIEVTTPEAAFIPVDYKIAKQPAQHYQIQLAAYAMMIEDHFGVAVSRGYLYLIPLRKAIEVQIGASLRNSVLRAISEMRTIVSKEWMPPATEYVQKCVDCEFRRFCNDV